ncbi:MAG: hypothetical protein EHM93_03000 [Bacteroidales bacterium]|nr:MAG: hypothetical protein EHM93_03000 [Bacteroidales bacterium]
MLKFSLLLLCLLKVSCFTSFCNDISIEKQNQKQDTIEFRDTFSSNAHYQCAVKNLQKNLFIDAEKCFEQYVDFYLKQGEENDVLNAYFRIGDLYRSKLLYSASLSYFLKALNISLKEENDFTGILYSYIGNIYYDQYNLDEALKNYYLSKAVFQKYHNEKRLASSYNNIGEIYRFKKEYKPAFENYQKAIELNLKLNNEASLAVNYNNLGLLYIEFRDFETAFQHLDKSRQILVKLGPISKQASINNSFGELFFSKNDYLAAVKHYTKTLEYSLKGQGDDIIIRRDAYNGLHKSYSKLLLFKEAYKNYCEYYSLAQQVINTESQRQIFEIQLKNNIDNYDKEILYLKRNAEIEKEKKRNNTIFFLLFIGLLVLLLYALMLRFKTYKQKTQIRLQKSELDELELSHAKALNNQLRLENIQFEANRKLDELTKINLEEKLDHKKRELSASALHLINKNEILNRIKSTLNDIELNKDKQAQTILNKITKEIEGCVNFDSDWDAFKLHFEEVHNNYFSNLILKYPDLTTDELKLCGYLRINLTSKEIAQILNITQAAINKRRNRLRKKFMINQDVDLHHFLSNISS